MCVCVCACVRACVRACVCVYYNNCTINLSVFMYCSKCIINACMLYCLLMPSLPIALIRQLYANGHIMAEEASHLTSSKLFKVPPPPSTDTLPITLNTTGNSIHNGIFQTASNFYSPATSIIDSSSDTNQKVFLAPSKEETSWPISQRHFKASNTSSLPVTLNTNANSVNDSVLQAPNTSDGSNKTHAAASDREPFLASTEANSDAVLTHECQLESQLVLEVPPTVVMANSIPPASHDNHTHDTEDHHTVTVGVTGDPLQSDHVQRDDDCNSVATDVADEEVVSSATASQSQSGCYGVADEPVLSMSAPSEYESNTVEGTISLSN